MKEKLLIIGDSAFAQIACEYFTYDSPYEVVAFSVEKGFLKRENILGRPVVPFEELEHLYEPSRHKAFVAVAYTQLNRLRARLYRETKEKGYAIVSYISSKAFVWRNVKIGENCFVFEDNTVQPFVTIGNNVILWSGNHIGHHSIIKDHSFISSHVVISGFCEIGEYCFIGVNATIANNIKIAKDCLIGAGTVILRNTEEGRIYASKKTEPLRGMSALSYFGVSDEARK